MKQNYNRKRGFEDDLERELKAAELFLSKANDDVIGKNNSSYINTEPSNKNFITDKELTNTILNNNNFSSNPNDSKLYTFADQQLNSSENISNQKIIKEDDLLLKYKKQLKSFGFPEIGKLIFESESDKEKTLKFFDFIMNKKSLESETRVSYKKQIESINYQLVTSQSNYFKIEKEYNEINEQNKKIVKEKKEVDSKLSK